MRDQIPKKYAHEFVVACFLEKDKHPDARPQKCACLLTCLDFQIIQIIAMVEDIAKSRVMDRKNQMTVSKFSLLAQDTVVIHHYVDLVGIEELVVA